MARSLTRATAASVAAGTAVATIVALANPAGAAGTASARRSGFGGHAYGSTVKIGSLARSGKTAYVPMCTTKLGATRTDKTAAVKLPGVGRIGAVTTRLASRHVANALRSRAHTHTATTNLLPHGVGHLIHAHALSTTAVASRSGGTTDLRGSTTIVGLRVGGNSISAHPRPNRKIEIPGVATVILNRQVRSRRYGNPTMSVTAMRVVVANNNTLNLPAGVIVVGRSVASLHKPTHHQVRGAAWGSTVRVGNTVKSGRTAPVYLPCGGSNGATLGNATAGLSVSRVVRTGDVASHATSSDSASGTVATTKNHTVGVNLLAGTIRAKAVTARAHVVRTDGKLVRRSRGTSVLALRINGQSQPVSAKPNTKLHVPGIGTLWVHRVIRTRNGMHVYGLQLILGRATHNLRKGTELTVAAAKVAVARH